MRVLICGDRHWTDYESIKRYIFAVKVVHPDTIIIQGECAGVDLMAKKAAIELGLPLLRLEEMTTKQIENYTKSLWDALGVNYK